MNCARINFSHATYESARETVDNVLEAKKRAKKNISILFDTKGNLIKDIDTVSKAGVFLALLNVKY